MVFLVPQLGFQGERSLLYLETQLGDLSFDVVEGFSRVMCVGYLVGAVI